MRMLAEPERDPGPLLAACGDAVRPLLGAVRPDVVLGIGEDAHTASLFPGAAALNEQCAWVTWSPPGTLPPPVDLPNRAKPRSRRDASRSFCINDSWITFSPKHATRHPPISTNSVRSRSCG